MSPESVGFGVAAEVYKFENEANMLVNASVPYGQGEIID